MKEIELVIKISEKFYETIKSDEYGVYQGHIYNIIRCGTPLPKGHGRLIDADVLGKKLNRYTEAPYQYALAVFNESSTIIEADRSVE